jgi:hypothetical protein
VHPVAGKTTYGLVDVTAIVAAVVIDLTLDIERRVGTAKDEIGHAKASGWAASGSVIWIKFCVIFLVHAAGVRCTTTKIEVGWKRPSRQRRIKAARRTRAGFESAKASLAALPHQCICGAAD